MEKSFLNNIDHRHFYRLEIPVEIKVDWENETALHILKEKVISLNVQEVYKDDSKEILREILVEDHDVDEEDADDFEVEVQEEIDEDNGVSTASNEVDDEEDNNEEDSDDGISQKRKVPRIFILSDDDDDDDNA